MDYEPGPVPPPTIGSRPIVTLDGISLEQIVVQRAPEFFALHDALITQHANVAAVASVDVDEEFAAIVEPVVGIVSDAITTLSAIDPTPVANALAESIADADGELGQLPSPQAVPQLPRAPDPVDTFEERGPVEPQPPTEPPPPPTIEPTIVLPPGQETFTEAHAIALVQAEALRVHGSTLTEAELTRVIAASGHVIGELVTRAELTRALAAVPGARLGMGALE